VPAHQNDRTSTRRRARTIVGALALGIGLVACSSTAPPAPTSPAGGSTSPSSMRPTGTEPAAPTGTLGTAPRTAPPRSDAKITTFEAPGTIACNGLVKITATTRYATTGAASVAFLVDNEQVPGSPPTSGTFELPMRCDGSTHTVVISAVDEQGRAAVMSKAILTDDRQSGG
jgi:hypothetical protein